MTHIEKANWRSMHSKYDIVIAVMGVAGAGKSTFISLLSNKKIKLSGRLQSCKHFGFMIDGVMALTSLQSQ